MYTTQTGRIQIFDQVSAHFTKTASSSTAKSIVKYCLAYSSLQCKRILYLIAARMTKNVGAFSLSCIACRPSFARHAIQCHGHFRGVEEGENAKMLILMATTTTIKIVIPLVTFFFPC